MNEQSGRRTAISALVSAAGKGVCRHGILRASALLLSGLIVTSLAARYTKSEVDAVAKREFDFVCNEIRVKILDRLSAHEQILRSGAAYYEDDSDGVTRDEWHRFTDRQKVDQQLPGIQGIGFALLIPRQQLAQRIQEIRAEGFSQYRVWPEGQRETYSSIIYIEPFAGRNLRAFGYDMLTEPVRREAMERARDQDAAALSGRVVLVQETDKDVQAGTLMYVPVYRVGMPYKTVAQRRAAILGWVYSPYRMNDLMLGIVGSRDFDLEADNRTHLEVFDGEKLSPETLLYDSQSAVGNERESASTLALQAPVDSAGRHWTLCFTQSGSQAGAVDYGKVWLVMLGGTSISMLLFGLNFSLLNTRFHALQIAKQLTAEYKRVENTLRESEALQRLLLASLPTGVVIVDPVTRVIERVNDHVATLFGESVDHLVGHRCHSLLCPACEGACPVCDLGRTVDNSDREMLRADGSRIPILKTVKRIQLNGQEKLLECFVDVSERRQMEQTLRESEANFRTFFESMTDMIMVGTPDGRVLFTNAAVTRMLGYSAEELAAMHMLDLHLADDRGEAEEIFGAMFRGERGSCPLPLAAKSGVLVPVETRVWFGRWNGVDCLFGICKNLSAEQEAQQRFERLFRNNPALMALSSLPDRRFSDVNNAFLKALGYSRDDVIGKSAAELSLFPHSEQQAVLADRLQVDGRIADFELQVQRKDGTILDGLFSGEVISNQGKQYLLTVMIDITERKRAENSLLHAKTELEHYAEALKSANKTLEEFNNIAESATRAKSAFLANMSHEIRTPMTAILGYADLLLNEEGLEKAPQDRRQNLETIKRNGEHLLGLINDILDLSKVEAGKMEIEPTRCSPFELLAEVVSLMRVRAEAKQLNLELELAGPLPETVLADPLRLRQVLVNLVGNAIKFTDQGEVRITARLIGDGDLPRLRFDVTDTGIGMNEEQAGKLFQPFTQVDNSSARKFGGTGLGLCISKRLAEALGGDIQVCSSPGKGSTFSVTIDPGPLNGIRWIQNAQEALLVRPPSTTAATQDKIELHGRVLLAEDGPDNQRLISFLLKKAGADVTLAENGQLAYDEALAAREAGQPFDVILMDMQMPVMDGYTATRELRSHGYTGPIVALTAHAMAEDRQKCLDAGCDDFATKPIDRQKLLTTVAHWMARRGVSEGSTSEHSLA
jgi:PAS domain S-box-containing protein